MVSEAYSEAMCAVLGSMLISYDAACEVMPLVREEMFADQGYRTIFRALAKVWAEQRSTDPVAVLEIAGQGHAQTIRELMDVTPTSANARKYAEVLRREFRLEKLRALGMALLDAANLDDALTAYREAESYAVGEESKVTHLSDGLSSWWEEMFCDREPDWLDWGFDRLNSNLHVAPGDFVVFGADSSVGKTAFAVQSGYAMAKAGKRVALFSAETSDAILIRRLVAQQAGITIPQQQNKLLGESQKPKMQQLLRESSGVVLDIVDCSDLTLDGIRALTVAGHYDVIWIDYIQLLDGPGQSSVEQVRNISRYFRRMSRALGVVIIGLSQLTVPDTAPKDWKPTKESLRESRQLKNDADQILLMYLVNRKVPSGARRLDITKQKEGTLGSLIFDFNGAKMLFKLRPKGAEEEEEKDDE